MRVVRAALAALVLAIGGTLALGAPAAQATDLPDLPIEFSADGVHWQSTPLASVYPGGFVIAPGNSRSSTLFLRSTDPHPVAMTIVVRDVTSDDAQFAAGLTLASTSNAGPGLQGTPFDSVADCTEVVPRQVVTTGQVVEVTLTTALSGALHSRHATRAHAGFRLVVGMADPAVAVGVAGCSTGGVVIPSTPADPEDTDGTDGTGGSGSGTPGVVALTGSDLLYPSLVVAGVALGVGWILVMLGKRRRRPESAPSKA